MLPPRGRRIRRGEAVAWPREAARLVAARGGSTDDRALRPPPVAAMPRSGSTERPPPVTQGPSAPRSRRRDLAPAAPGTTNSTPAMVSIKEMKETIKQVRPESLHQTFHLHKQAGLPLADLIERADVEERYGDALARLGEADELKARRARASEPGPDAKRPRTSADPPPATSSSRPAATPRAAEPATAKTSPPAAATAKTPPPPDALAQPVAETLSHVSPAALARLAQTSRAWREAARDAGVLCVVTKM